MITLRILYLINYAGKAGTEKYVENLVRIFSAAGNECHFAYNIAGELSEKMAARGVPCLQLDLAGWPTAASTRSRSYTPSTRVRTSSPCSRSGTTPRRGWCTRTTSLSAAA